MLMSSALRVRDAWSLEVVEMLSAGSVGFVAGRGLLNWAVMVELAESVKGEVGVVLARMRVVISEGVERLGEESTAVRMEVTVWLSWL